MNEDATTIRPGEHRESAIPKLLDQEGGRLYALGLRLCGGPEAAEDLVQEIFLNAFKGWESFDGRSSVRTWLYSIATHACQRMKRKRAGEPAVVLSLDELLPTEAETMVDIEKLDGLPEDAFSSEREEAVAGAISELEDDFRMPLVLKDIVGLSMATVASILDLKENTVKTRVHRARLKIRAALEGKLPRKKSVPLAYSKQVCLDLLEAKQATLDRGLPFPLDDIICERCQALFRSLDLADDVCRHLGEGDLPRELRDRLLSSMKKK